jgi:hypothetical protein
MTTAESDPSAGSSHLEGDADSGPGQTPGRFDRTVAIVGIAATLIGSLVGSLVGAKISADATIGGVETQISASSDKERREKVSQVYSDYLKAVDAYVSATNFLRSPGILEPVPIPTASGGVGIRVQENSYDRYETARSNMQGRINDLYAFGTPEAWEVNLLLQATLPQLFAPGRTSIEALTYDTKAYEAAYLKFTRIYCREVASDSKPHCGESLEPSPRPTGSSMSTPP